MIVRRWSDIETGPATAEEWAEARRLARRSREEVSADEDAAITADAMSDPDSGLMSEDELDRAQWTTFADAASQSQDVLRLDNDVSARLRESGEDWQARANEILRRALEAA